MATSDQPAVAAAPPADPRGSAVPPRAYWVWLGGTQLSVLGTQILAFAMAWAASGRGGLFAGLVLTAINLPRVLLLLVGGAVADRVGPWRVLIVADAMMVGVTLALAVGAWSVPDPAVFLLVAALAIGAVDAFGLPASGALPRLLVSPAALARALSARQVAGQLAVFAGPPLGGLLVAAAGLVAAALATAGTFAVLLFVLALLRPRHPTGQTLPDRPRLRSAVIDGMWVAARDPVLRTALLLVMATAAVLLPVSGLLVPLLARDNAWSARSAGSVVGVVALGVAVVAATVAVRGAWSSPGRTAGAGLLLAAVGVGALASAPTVSWAVPAAALVGLGTGGVTTVLAPLILGSTPGTHLARVQAVLVLAQGVPLLVTHNLLGWLADAVGTSTALYGCAATLTALALTALRAPTPSPRPIGAAGGAASGK
ncbi:MFS transporter [Micromonospora sp. WMMA1923]|uniref:MFS transporter n=1 Tax=Micromonospora sp. WMMA1923 TaxID=3404125 RepID=UPI003B9268E0